MTERGPMPVSLSAPTLWHTQFDQGSACCCTCHFALLLLHHIERLRPLPLENHQHTMEQARLNRHVALRKSLHEEQLGEVSQ